MLLFLMRHGSAEPGLGSDADRRLTDRGRSEVQAIAHALQRARFEPGVIVHSPLVRAQQSADLLSAWFGGLRCVEVPEVVEGGDALLARLEELGLENPLVLGHEPGIPRLATRMTGLTERLLFHCAAVAVLSVDSFTPRAPARLLLFIDPHVLGSAP
ncbi:MAG: histidine phosphatase family protein [Myxococcota bacterium]|nr:histidine phosphatase family protein [Myxococcota bacterium]